MRVVASPSVLSDRSDLQGQLWDIAVEAQTLDPDIHLHGLFVSVKRSRYEWNWEGHAWPDERTWDARRKQLFVHPAGKITLTLGSEVEYPDIVRLFAHELRHIGQFHRNRYETGWLGTSIMPEFQVEPDALAFEELVLEKMGLPKLNEYNELQAELLGRSPVGQTG